MKSLRNHGFTLIELLVVMAIILLLAGLVMAAAGNIQKKGSRSRAEGEIAAMTAALEQFKNDNGDYPFNTNSLSNSLMVSALMPQGGKVYYEFRRKSLDTSNNYLDPWGTSYRYQYPGDSNRNGTNFFDLWSTAGGSANSNTWIKNW